MVRRMERALVRRDVRGTTDPLRAQARSLVVGVVLAVLGLAACGVLALLRPQQTIADHRIVVGKESGSLYVVLGDRVHPALNLASARLAAGQAAEPAIVAEHELAQRPRGPLVGIPGAPSALPFDESGQGRAWTVCDRVDGDAPSTVLVVGTPVDGGARARDLEHGRALLVEHAGVAYLVYDGHRARVDLRDRAVTGALAIDGVQPRTVSAGLLAAIPEVPPIIAPRIDGAGTRPSHRLADIEVGSVIAVPRGETTGYYVVLRSGVQQIGVATADLIRFTDSRGAPDIRRIAPDVLAAVPLVTELDVATFPDSAPVVRDPGEAPVSCLSWQPDSRISVLSGRDLPVAATARPVGLAQADGSGPLADAAYVEPGTGAFVQTTGAAPDNSRSGGLCYVADTGVRYGIADAATAGMLGVGPNPEPAPWSIVSLLAPGPVLSQEQARIAHDGVAPDPAPAALPAQ